MNGWRAAAVYQGFKFWNGWCRVGSECSQDLECLVSAICPAQCHAVKLEGVSQGAWQFVDAAPEPVVARVAGQALEEQVQVVGPQDEQRFASLRVVDSVTPRLHGKSLIRGFAIQKAGGNKDAETRSAGGGYGEPKPLAHVANLHRVFKDSNSEVFCVEAGKSN